jgi:hypothetical protein
MDTLPLIVAAAGAIGTIWCGCGWLLARIDLTLVTEDRDVLAGDCDLLMRTKDDLALQVRALEAENHEWARIEVERKRAAEVLN